MAEMRVRVRPLEKAKDHEVASAWSNRLCLSVPHIGEAIDMAGDAYRMRTAVEVGRGPVILHYGHELGRPCAEAEENEAGRCLIVDYVPAVANKGGDEIAVEGLVAAGKAG